jgi:ABC-type Na+ transport system ATPase subunit NatA
MRPWSKYTPSHFTSSLDSTIIPSGSVIVASLAFFDIMKWISSVLVRSNCIVFSEASLYTILTSRCNILVFFHRLVDFVIIEMSSIYEMYLTRLELAWGVSNRLRIYIKKRIGKTGFPWGIFVFIGKKSSI